MADSTIIAPACDVVLHANYPNLALMGLLRGGNPANVRFAATAGDHHRASLHEAVLMVAWHDPVLLLENDLLIVRVGESTHLDSPAMALEVAVNAILGGKGGVVSIHLPFSSGDGDEWEAGTCLASTRWD